MRGILPLLLLFSLFLCACGKDTDKDERPAADFVAQEILEQLGREQGELNHLNETFSEQLSTYVERIYGLHDHDLRDFSVYLAGGTEAFEIAIFSLEDGADADAVAEALEAYRLSRQSDFHGYNPEQSAIVENARIIVTDSGDFAALLICQDMERALYGFWSAMADYIPVAPVKPDEEPGEEDVPVIQTQAPHELIPPVPSSGIDNESLPDYWLPYVDPEIDDMSLYDTSAILDAWENGNDEGLSEKDKKVYEKCEKLIDRLIGNDMSDWEKEWAVYAWLVENCEYDYRHYEIPNSAPRESYEPYGALIDGEAVCLGYATAFQLLMDMLKIECITVVGAAFHSMEDHAWNMVKLDGMWYCVDVTWENVVRDGPEFCNYFNVSSDWMAVTGHQWDYASYPIASAEGDGSWHEVIWLPVEE